MNRIIPQEGPKKYFSVCPADTEIRDGCSCSILSRHPSGKVDLPWAGGRPFGGRRQPRANVRIPTTVFRSRCGVLTAVPWRTASAVRQDTDAYLLNLLAIGGIMLRELIYAQAVALLLKPLCILCSYAQRIGELVRGGYVQFVRTWGSDVV
ncbi:hypothetical protein NDU88_004161 [Pleurodeles waltl]|uniref:Uncharacterized protein n=1 Tax=Pleurodeles waltl TaxID=8319 RepID=A0AAV7W888_PLEWA|nr:hypothetical protein NDU88_004161 [Pleurodeles waltl]